MYIKRKIPAFTLMEVTIAMLIASVAIAVTYTAYHIISKTYINYAKKQDRIATFTLADKLLKKDFLVADHIIKTEEGLEMQLGSTKTTYFFRDSCLLRSQQPLQIDTFKLPVHGLNVGFENEDAIEAGSVDHLKYETQLEGESIILSYRKVYSSQNLFK